MQARMLGEPEEVTQQQEFKQMTQGGYPLDEVVSSLTKEIRRGNEDRALYWALEMCNSGYSRYFWTRLSVLVPEEIGLADTNALVVVNNAAQMFERRIKKWAEGPVTIELIGMVILYLCRAPKNGEAAYAAYAINDELAAGRKEEVQDYSLDMHTSRGRDRLRKAGWDKEQEDIWFWLELVKKAHTVGGNRWIRRLMTALKNFTSDSREQVIQDQLSEYSETEANQL